MAAETFPCPECKATLRNSSELRPGDLVQCPQCRTQFAVPASPAAMSDPTAPAEAYTDAPGAPRPRFSGPGDEDVTATRRPAYYGGRRGDDEPDEDYPARPFTGGYAIDLGRWFAAARQHYGAILGPAVGFVLLAGILSIIPYAAILGGAPVVGFQVAPGDPGARLIITQIILQLGLLFLMPLVFYPLWNGLTAVCLAQLKGRPWAFGDFFSGFQHYGALAGVGLTAQLLSLAASLPQLFFAFAAAQSRNLQLLAVGPFVGLVGLVCIVFFQVRLLVFAPTIVLDRNLGAMDAIKANWELTRGHFWGLFGVSILLGLINAGGALACGVGLLFAVPYTLLILNAGYLLITGARTPDDFIPRFND